MNTLNGSFCLRKKTVEGSRDASPRNGEGVRRRAQLPLLQNMGEDRKSFDRLSRYCAGITQRAGVGAAAETPPFAKIWMKFRTCSLEHALEKIAWHCAHSFFSFVFGGASEI